MPSATSLSPDLSYPDTVATVDRFILKDDTRCGILMAGLMQLSAVGEDVAEDIGEDRAGGAVGKLEAVGESHRFSSVGVKENVQNMSFERIEIPGFKTFSL